MKIKRNSLKKLIQGLPTQSQQKQDRCIIFFQFHSLPTVWPGLYPWNGRTSVLIFASDLCCFKSFIILETPPRSHYPSSLPGVNYSPEIRICHCHCIFDSFITWVYTHKYHKSLFCRCQNLLYYSTTCFFSQWYQALLIH